MEVWAMIEEVAMGILSTVGVIMAIILRSEKPKSPEKQAKWEEETKIKRREQKMKRLSALREDDEKCKEKMLNNLKEEVEIEKELGENGTNA